MASDATRYGEEVEQNGLSSTHEQIIAWVSPGASVLELGCASGYIGKILGNQKGCRVTGIELDPNAAREARANGLKVLDGSLEDTQFRASVKERFDFVLATDVLEHLKDPAPVLDHFKQWLAPEGRAIIAVPNIATWQIRNQLMFSGDFEYHETGILDRTHLHFFTWNTLHKLVRQQGWSVVDTMAEWRLPFGRHLLLEAPKDARGYIKTLAAWGAPGRLASSVVDPLAARIQKSGHELAHRIFHRWPNACAYHIALLLSPPDESLTPPSVSRPELS